MDIAILSQRYSYNRVHTTTNLQGEVIKNFFIWPVLFFCVCTIMT